MSDERREVRIIRDGGPAPRGNLRAQITDMGAAASQGGTDTPMVVPDSGHQQSSNYDVNIMRTEEEQIEIDITYPARQGTSERTRNHTYHPKRCRLCRKKFFRWSIMNVQVRVHTEEHPFICATCRNPL